MNQGQQDGLLLQKRWLDRFREVANGMDRERLLTTHIQMIIQIDTGSYQPRRYQSEEKTVVFWALFLLLLSRVLELQPEHITLRQLLHALLQVSILFGQLQRTGQLNNSTTTFYFMPCFFRMSTIWELPCTSMSIMFWLMKVLMAFSVSSLIFKSNSSSSILCFKMSTVLSLSISKKKSWDISDSLSFL